MYKILNYAIYCYISLIRHVSILRSVSTLRHAQRFCYNITTSSLLAKWITFCLVVNFNLSLSSFFKLENLGRTSNLSIFDRVDFSNTLNKNTPHLTIINNTFWKKRGKICLVYWTELFVGENFRHQRISSLDIPKTKIKFFL